jgi:hypothetical protein
VVNSLERIETKIDTHVRDHATDQLWSQIEGNKNGVTRRDTTT